MKFLAALLVLVSMNSEANVCASDTKKFCAGVEPGKGQIAKCLDDYVGQLAPACAKELKEFRSKSTKKNPCFEDLAEFCVDIPSDAKKLELCILKNENRLSATCAADFKKKKSNILVKDVCSNDIVSNCYADLKGPDGAVTKCLIKNKAKLSPFCQKQTNKKIETLKKANACFEDTEKFCPTQVAFNEIQECLEKKQPSLKPECKKLVQIEISKAQANPCYKDLRKHCRPGISSNDQHRCLTINENELSNACKQFRVNEAEKIKKMVELCESDRIKLCPKAPFQNGMVIKCLEENKAKVSPACKALL
jgi:hypothetical protein